jgi:AIPR protein
MVLPGFENFPYFLQSYENLSEHLRELFDEQQLSPKEKGDRFVEFVTKIIPLTEIGIQVQFETIELRKHSHDEGIDIVCMNAERTHILYVQSKLTLNKVEDVATIFSNWQNYMKKHHPAPELGLWSSEVDKKKYPDVSFMIVTLSKLDNIVNLYAKGHYSSQPFYSELKDAGKLELYGGLRLFPLLQNCYRKMHILPTNVVLRLDSQPIERDGVYIGIISAAELKKCYDQFGDALFLENIRSFLGATSGKKKVSDKRENVNEEILATAREAPTQMLARNNGITFRARTVERQEETVLRLDEGSIVNGCQTTMCLIQAPSPEAFILVKIVEAPKAWEIAKTANFQNKVEHIQLILAEHVNIPLVKETGMKGEVHIHSSKYISVLDVFSTFYQHEVAYDEIEYLFIGLFSRNIRNIIDANYTEIRDDLLKTIQGQEETRGDVFYAIFELYIASSKAAEIVREIQREDELAEDESEVNIFQRFWNDNKPYYRSFLAILTACEFINTNIYGDKIRSDDFREFLMQLRTELKSDRERFIRYYQYTFDVVAMQVVNTEKEEREVKQRMYDWFKRVNFDTLFQTCRRTINSRERQRQRGV